MPETPNNVNKQVYVSKENLQKILELLRDKNAALYLGKYDEAASAAKVKAGLKITVGDAAEFKFDGSEEKQIAVAAKIHKHAASDITDLKSAVNKIVFGNEDNTGIVMAHEHLNLSVLDGISSDDVAAWDAKIGVNDVERLAYTNATAMPGVDNVKKAIDVLVKNIQIGNAALADTTANVNGLAGRLTTAEGDIATLKTTVGDASSGLVKDVADLKTSVGNNANDIADLKAANAAGGAVDTAIKEAKAAAEAAQATANQAVADAATEAERAKGEEAKLAGRLDVVQGTGDGSIAKVLDDAKKYAKEQADGKDAAIAAAKSAADAAQADVDTLEGVVGSATDGTDANTVFGKIAKAQAQADKGVSNAAAEKTRAEAAEKTLDDKIKAEAQARENADNALDSKLTAEIERAQGAESALDTRVTANKAAIDKLNGSVDTPGSVANAVKKEETRATAIEQGLRTDVNANKAAIETLNGDGEGSVNKKIQTAIAEVNTAAGNLENRVKANEDAIAIINGTGEGSIKDAVAKLVNGAPEAMDTLKELADSITKHQTAYDAYVAQVAKDIAAAKQAAITEAGKNADTKDTALHNTITGEIATAKSEAISTAATDAAGKENKLQPKIDAKVAQADYDTKVAALEKADADNLAAAKKHADDEDAKIEAILGHKAEDDLTATGLCKDVADNAAAITAEATARQDADKLLSDRIAKFEGNGTGSVAAQVQSVKDALDTFEEEQATKDQGQDANITANKDAIDAVKGRLNTAESKLNVIQGEGEGSIKKAVTDAKSDIKNVTDGLGTRIDGLDTRVTALEATVNTATTGLKDKMAAAEKDIDKLQADMTAAQGDINGINTDITNIQNTLLNLVPLGDDELQAMLDQVYTK